MTLWNGRCVIIDNNYWSSLSGTDWATKIKLTSFIVRLVREIHTAYSIMGSNPDKGLDSFPIVQLLTLFIKPQSFFFITSLLIVNHKKWCTNYEWKLKGYCRYTYFKNSFPRFKIASLCSALVTVDSFVTIFHIPSFRHSAKNCFVCANQTTTKKNSQAAMFGLLVKIAKQ